MHDIGAFTAGSKWFWPLFAGGAVYGLAAAKAHHGFTPLVMAGAGAYLMSRAQKKGIHFDERLTGHNWI